MVDFKETLLLPKTEFPMRGQLPVLETQLLKKWEENKLSEQIQAASQNKPRFVLHDGPPYANGLLHHGHILNKILKDMVVRDRFMAGFGVDFRPGWDCHGLPIENQVDKELGGKKHTMDKGDFHAHCAAYAQRFIALQRTAFQRLGIEASWSNPYLTMDKPYEASVLRCLGRMGENGLLHRALRPVNWCVHHQTALAEAEVEYAEKRSPSATVAFPVVEHALPVSVPLFIVIWTTTPWTLPANQAVCVHADYDYGVYLDAHLGRAYLVACNSLGALAKALRQSPDELKLLYTLRGKDCTSLRYRLPLAEQSVHPVLTATHVTLEQGVGCVHTAPAHGLDDFVVGQSHGLSTVSVLQANGTLSTEAGEYAGLSVEAANTAILSRLRTGGFLLSSPEDTLMHRYPHCWRCQKPIVVRATYQWFMAMDRPYLGGATLRERALSALEHIHFVPEWGKERILGMLRHRPDWCLTRQRSWGVPLPVWYCMACEHPHINTALADKLAEQVAHAGVACLWHADHKTLQEWYPDWRCERCGHATARQEQDIVDVWIESGLSFMAVLDATQRPADVYLEGSDQHRGWFHSSLLCALAMDEPVPFHSLVTHGFVVDGQGKKISKSKGNYIDPAQSIVKHGAELYRLWVAQEDYTHDVRLSAGIIEQLSESYRKVRNVLRFFLGNLSGFKPEDMPPVDDWPALERYVAYEWGNAIHTIRQHFANCSFHLGLQVCNEKLVHLFSSFYFDIRKDVLYAESATSLVRRSAQACLYVCLHSFIRLLAPVLAFTTEEAWGYLGKLLGHEESSVHVQPYPLSPSDSVFLPIWSILKARKEVCDLEQAFAWVYQLRRESHKALEEARTQGHIRSSLEACLRLQLPYAWQDILQRLGFDKKMFADLLIVSQVEFSFVHEALSVAVNLAQGSKCARCWLYFVNDTAQHSTPEAICGRCQGVLACS